ncbi:MAG: hypothetical protein ACRDL5_12080 [Solirubrobacteraceae bacterium]
MSPVTGHTDRQPLDHDVVAWRVGRLRDAGFSPQVAGKLARDRRYDLHALLELVDRGCRPELAARIMAPLDELER